MRRHCDKKFQGEGADVGRKKLWRDNIKEDNDEEIPTD